MPHRIWNQKMPPAFSLGSGFFPFNESPRRFSGWQVSRFAFGMTDISFSPLFGTTQAQFIFSPQFSLSTDRIKAPGKIISDPIIKGFSWDWLEFYLSPVKDLVVNFSFWVAGPSTLCTEIGIHNHSDRSMEVDIDLVSELKPQYISSKLEYGEYRGRVIITGSQENTKIAWFSSGNPQMVKGASPILRNQISIPKDQISNLRWVCVLQDLDRDPQVDFDRILRSDWEGEIAYRKIRDQAAIQIWTGNDDWDLLLALSQKEAARLSQQIQNIPEGAEKKSDLTPLQALAFLQSLTVIPSETVEKLLDQIFSGKNNEMDSRYPPIFLIELLWQLFQRGVKPSIWNRHIPQAITWLESWFSPELDQDGDGIPELIHPRVFDLAGQEELVDINTGSGILPYPYIESPGLAAILANDLIKLTDMDPTSGKPIRKKYLDILINYLDGSWDPEMPGFQNRDSISHTSLQEDEVNAVLNSGLNLVRLELSTPSRIGIINTRSGVVDNLSSSIRIHIHGLDWKGAYRIEEMRFESFETENSQIIMLTESIFQRIDYCLLEGIQPDIQLKIVLPGTIRDDISAALPFWVNDFHLERVEAPLESILFDKDRFLTAFGLCSIPGTNSGYVQLIWNILAAQILLQAGRSRQAYSLFSRWMKAAQINMQEAGGFYPAWNGNSGRGIGMKNGLDTLLPTRLLLSLAGIRIKQDGNIQFEEKSVLPDPIMVKIMGYQITREGKKTVIITPGGKTRSIDGASEILLFRR